MGLLYIGFIAFIAGLLALDLGVFHRKLHVIGVREALGWSAFWISLGVSFSGFIYLGYDQHWFGLGTAVDTMAQPTTLADGSVVYNDGGSAVLKYLTGFVVEKSLSIDNIFVIAMIFGAFAVPAMYQHRVLFWGILGALLMRGVMIGVGTALIVRFSWIIYVFGGFLVITGVRMLLAKDEESKMDDNILVRAIRRIVPITAHYHGAHFFVRAGSAASLEPPVPGAAVEKDRMISGARAGALMATPLFLTLVLVELTDVVFAVDSIPAIFAITTDPFLVFTSNVFAILGLRSLYFALAGMMDRFRYLKVALSFVLVIVGVKMMTHGPLKRLLGESFNFYVLGVIAGIIATGVLASLLIKPRDEHHAGPPAPPGH
jgi:tellurite resistance protein TerC